MWARRSSRHADIPRSARGADVRAASYRWGPRGLGGRQAPQRGANLRSAPRNRESRIQDAVQQFGNKDWKGQYQTLVSSQKKIVSQAAYIGCRSGEASPISRGSRR